MAEDWQQKLGLLLANLGGGISSAASANLPAWHGIGPGAMGFANALGQQQKLASQQAQQQELMDLQRRQFGLREQEFTDKRDERQKLQAARMGWTPPGATPGMGVPQAAPTIGPGSDYFTRVGGDESGGKYDIRNAKGSGAYGKYQFMPDTWADVATKNPQLGLPFNIAQSTPEQQEAAMRALTASNAQSLQQRGIQPAPENLYLAHRFGVEGASKVHGADPSTPIAALFPPQWAAQNPDMQGVTVGQFRQNVGGRYGGAPMPQVAQGDNIPRADGSGTPLPPSPATLQPPGAPPQVPRPQLPPEDAQRLTRAVQTMQMTPQQAETEARQIITDLWTRQQTASTAAWQQQNEQYRFRRGQEAETDRYNRGLDEKERRAAEAREQAGTKRGDEQSKLKIETEDKLRDDFDKSEAVKSYRAVVPMLESAKDAVIRPTRAADLNLVYAFAKLMDPGSVVRESETGMVVATGTVSDRLGGLIGQLNGGQMLQPETRQKLIAELESRFKSLEASYLATEDAYKGIAKNRGLNFDNIRVPIRSAASRQGDNTPTDEELKRWSGDGKTAKPGPIRIDMSGRPK